jgi:hypothetical protein
LHGETFKSKIQSDKTMTKLTLIHGATGFINDKGQWTCTGSQMGRSDSFHPGNYDDAPAKLRLIRLPFVDGCYDSAGCYWGGPANVWCAFGGEHSVRTGKRGFAQVEYQYDVYEYMLFVRAGSRDMAKRFILADHPSAIFFR